MATRSRTPSHDVYAAAPNPTEPAHLTQTYGSVSGGGGGGGAAGGAGGAGGGGGSRPNSYMATNSIVPSDFQVRGVPANYPAAAAASQPTRFQEDFTLSQRGSVMIDGVPHPHPPPPGELQRADSQMSVAQSMLLPSRAGTLKKKASLSKKGSLRRGGSRRSSRAGSVKSMELGDWRNFKPGDDVVDHDENNAFHIPIPTTGSPTDVLAARFQAWRKVLKDLVSVFREIQKSYETRAKLLITTSNTMNSIIYPETFLTSNGIAEATNILRDYHKLALQETNKARALETDVIVQLTGLRADLQQKIKEIKSLSGDFKNSVHKEVEGTRKAVDSLQRSISLVDTDPSATSGKGDPFLLKCAVDRQLEKQIEEENYLHRAFLNLESSGRELEAIVVGEIQKAYNLYANLLRRDAEVATQAADQLSNGPVSMPKDHEWSAFISNNDHLVDPKLPLRHFENITYPGRDHPAAAEVRSGMLERKSKYLKSYTPGWYVLSPTHLHEYKSADRIEFQTPVMSLYLPEQKLGSHSQDSSTSHKFMLKGRQTGSMHRGHAWVFRAESHDTMLAWYEDIKNLTEITGEARNAFVRRHARTLSGGSYRPGSISSDGVMDEDEADETPYSASVDHVMPNYGPPTADGQWQRPQPGGRFPSDDVQTNRHLHMSYAPSSRESFGDRNEIVQTGPHPDHITLVPYDQTSGNRVDGVVGPERPSMDQRHGSNYGDWMAPAATASPISTSQRHNRTSYRTPTPDASQRLPTGTSRSPSKSVRYNDPEALSRPSTLADNRTSVTATTTTSIMDSVPYPNGALVDGTPLSSPATTIAPTNFSKNTPETNGHAQSIISDLKLPGQYPGPGS
ncbi:hypothetical protein FQN55_005309 [Onygenales sp. PD_40]|nr:hypothetical protein FQN55_005309 [Onygenales sp. PD_40]KAK2762967.1 hypothetical protein FQN53_007407 [Emmonsiellopsis sp. PD_33]KAK2793900.1 hypothetical protein FQN52_000231 [Onygenales sp. PD_12]KAK2802601.1 hypothetical protein FQN51_004394 [Onygenales sp. PD_10]